MPRFSIRLRAWLLRTFKGRSRADAGWEDESTWVSSPPQAFRLGRLEIAVSPLGVKAAGANPPSAVYEVRIAISGEARSWSSKYGLPASDNSACLAAETALDDIYEAWRAPDVWRARALAGMTAAEAEAIEDSPAMRLDLDSASWIGPELDSVPGQGRKRSGSWLTP